MSSVPSSPDSLSDIEQSTFKTIATFVSDLSEILLHRIMNWLYTTDYCRRLLYLMKLV